MPKITGNAEVPISRILLVLRRFVGGQGAKRRSRRKMSVEVLDSCRSRASSSCIGVSSAVSAPNAEVGGR
jgi:hypothetical protein